MVMLLEGNIFYFNHSFLLVLASSVNRLVKENDIIFLSRFQFP